MKVFTKNKLLILFSSIILINSIQAQETKSPFEKYDPNQKLNTPTVAGSGVINPATGLTQEQEMQVRDLIFQELSLKDEALNMQKQSGLINYDEDEILYLGQTETLKGVAKNQYIIFNSATNLFRYVNQEEYKKIITYKERTQQKEEQNNAVN